MVLPEYPRIPHLPYEPNANGDDLIAEDHEAGEILGSTIWVTEKVDGTQVSAALVDGNFVVRNRSGMLGKGRTGKSAARRQYAPLWNWLYQNRWCFEALNEAWNKPMVVHGEWCWMRHGIAYDALPDYFLVFGLTGLENAPHPSQELALDSLLQFGFNVVPTLMVGTIASFGELTGLRDGESDFIREGDRRREGIVVRTKTSRFKAVRPDFVPGRYFDTKIVRNQLRRSDVLN